MLQRTTPCVDCGTDLACPARGRPPKRCDGCRDIEARRASRARKQSKRAGAQPVDQYERARAERYDEDGNGRCVRCRKYKPDSEYGRTKLRRDGLQVECRRCYADRSVRRRYGGRSYEETLAEQDGKCRMCSVLEAESARFVFDHDHACCPGDETCGACFRGLICRRCNVSLRYYEDEELAEHARNYLLGR